MEFIKSRTADKSIVFLENFMMKIKYGRITREKNSFIGLVREVLYKKHIIVIAALIGAVLLMFINFFIIPPAYASISRLYIVNSEASTTTKVSNINISRMLTRDYTELVRSNGILLKVIDELELDLDSMLLKEYISIHTPKDTRMLEIRVVSQSPELSTKIVNALVRISAKEFTEISGIAKFNILELGSPPLESERPDIFRIILLGGCYGSFISIIGIIRFIKTNECITSADDVEYWLGLSNLGDIPLERAEGKEKIKPGVKMQPGPV